jgi:hypothetical protein
VNNLASAEYVFILGQDQGVLAGIGRAEREMLLG